MDDWQRLRELVAQATPQEREVIRDMVARLRPVAEIEAVVQTTRATRAKRSGDMIDSNRV